MIFRFENAVSALSGRLECRRGSTDADLRVWFPKLQAAACKSERGADAAPSVRCIYTVRRVCSCAQMVRSARVLTLGVNCLEELSSARMNIG